MKLLVAVMVARKPATATSERYFERVRRPCMKVSGKELELRGKRKLESGQKSQTR
jgi:hypothetical protein